MTAPTPCPDRCTCSALVALGYLTIHCAAGELWSVVAFPNSQTLALSGAAWVATPQASSGFDLEDLIAIARDRGGSVLLP